MRIREILFDQVSGAFIACLAGLFLISLSTYVNGDLYGIWSGAAPIIIGVTITCTWLTRLHAYREAERIRLKYTIIHSTRVIWRVVIAVFIGGFIHVYGDMWTLRALYLAIACALYIGGLFWLLFDFMLNKDRLLPIFYVSMWYKTAWLDRFFSRDPRWWLVSKVVVYLISLYLYLRVFEG